MTLEDLEIYKLNLSTNEKVFFIHAMTAMESSHNRGCSDINVIRALDYLADILNTDSSDEVHIINASKLQEQLIIRLLMLIQTTHREKMSGIRYVPILEAMVRDIERGMVED